MNRSIAKLHCSVSDSWRLVDAVREVEWLVDGRDAGREAHGNRVV